MNFTSLGTCVLYAGLAGLFTWGITALGAAMVLLTRRFSSRGLDCMLGFGAGVMLASSFWSLLLPGLNQAEALAMNGWLTAALGLLCGAAAVDLGGRLCHRLNLARHNSSSVRRCQLLIGAITLHNIPEGMAVGVAFGALAGGGGMAALSGACMLALGIGLQNFPEGAAVSLPLRREGMSRGRAFFFGQLSGFVEPTERRAGRAAGGHAAPGAALSALLCGGGHALGHSHGNGAREPGILGPGPRGVVDHPGLLPDDHSGRGPGVRQMLPERHRAASGILYISIINFSYLG